MSTHHLLTNNGSVVNKSSLNVDIVIGFDEPMLQVTEGINMSIFVCGFVRSQTGIWKMNLSAAIVQTDGAAKGW